MKKLITILFLLAGLSGYAQIKVTTQQVICDTLRSRATDKIIEVLDTVLWPNGTKQWAGRDFGATLGVGSIPFGGTNSRVGGVFRNSTVFVWDSTNKRLAVNLTTPTATLHARGSSAVSGDAFLIQNSTPLDLFKITNAGTFTYTLPSIGQSFEVAPFGSVASVTFGTTGVKSLVTVCAGSTSDQAFKVIDASSNTVLYTSSSGTGYWGRGVSLATSTTNAGLKFSPGAGGNTATSALVAGVLLTPSTAAGANNQVLTQFALIDSAYSDGVFTGVTHNTLDIMNASRTSLFKINATGTPTATFSIPVTTAGRVTCTQLLGATGFGTGATITLLTERTHIVSSGASTTTVNFPTGVEGLEITIINQKVGGITVTSHLDYTGAAQTTQAAQSSATYIYINGAWNKR